jgi:hypothetical protein
MIGDDQGLGFGPVNCIADLVLAVDEHPRDEHRTDTCDGVVGDYGVNPVRKLDSHPVTQRYAELGQTRSQPPCSVPRLDKGQLRVTVSDTQPIGSLVSGAVEEIGQHLVGPQPLIAVRRHLLRREASLDGRQLHIVPPLR